MVTREDVVKGKPEPDLWLEACKRINIDPKTIIGFEDADLGIESLGRAGAVKAVDVRKFTGYPTF